MMKKNKMISLILLHLLLLAYSLGGICSKLAGQQVLFSAKFFLYYGIVLMILVIYALLWQQILKRLPLITAYANKSVVVIWGILWGSLFFDEKMTFYKIAGAIIIIIGVYFVVSSDKMEEKNK